MRLTQPSESTVQHAGFLLTSGLGISFLVFLNAAQPFVLNDLLKVPRGQTGRVSGTLLLCDELLALFCVLLWGRLSDLYSARLVTATANLIIALAFFLFVLPRNPFPQLLLARLIFAVGSAGVTAMLSALLSILSTATPQSVCAQEQEPVTPASEDQPLLGWARSGRPPHSPSSPPPLSVIRHSVSTRLAAMLGVCTGLGALLAVFVFLRLPARLSPKDAAHGLKATFRTVGAIACANALIALVTLPTDENIVAPKRYKKWSILREIRKLTRGFAIGLRNANLSLGFAAGFAARAQTIIITSFIPLYIASYYRNHGLCGDNPDPDVDLKEGCHPAYSFASALTGVIQLIALLFAPFLSFTRSPSKTLSIALFLGVVGFLILGRNTFIPSPADEEGWDDPRSPWTWTAAVGLGIAQICGVVLSLSVVSEGRREVLESKQGFTGLPDDASISSASDKSEDEGDDDEIAGALAGAYSFCGGLGIIFVSGIGGLLVDGHPQSPFVLMAAVNMAVLILAVYVAWAKRKVVPV